MAKKGKGNKENGSGEETGKTERPESQAEGDSQELEQPTEAETEAPEGGGEGQEEDPGSEEKGGNGEAEQAEPDAEEVEAPLKPVNPILETLSKFAVQEGLRDTSQIQKWHRFRDPETQKFYLIIDFYDNQGQYKRKRRDI